MVDGKNFFGIVAGVKEIVKETGEAVPYCVASNGNRVEINENPENRGGIIGFEIDGVERTGKVFEEAEEIFAHLENGLKTEKRER